MKTPQLNRKYPSGAAKRRKGQGYIHASCQLAEMAFCQYYEYSVLIFSTDISGGLNLAYA